MADEQKPKASAPEQGSAVKDALEWAGRKIFGNTPIGRTYDILKDRPKKLDDEIKKQTGSDAGEIGKSWNDHFNC